MNQFLPATAAELVQILCLLPHPEGGFFVETFRSGTVGMSSKGQTNFDTQDHNLVVTKGRDHRRPDNDSRRNCLTSIFWVPTLSSPTQPLVCNVSDHVHYYQGGLPMQYTQYDINTKTLETIVLGPDIRKGQLLQYAVLGGNWKCARLLTEFVAAATLDGKEAASSEDVQIHADYSLIAEAVGPGFDFHDFSFVTAEELEKQPEDVQKVLMGFLHASLAMPEIEEHYDNKTLQQEKTQERL